MVFTLPAWTRAARDKRPARERRVSQAVALIRPQGPRASPSSGVNQINQIMLWTQLPFSHSALHTAPHLGLRYTTFPRHGAYVPCHSPLKEAPFSRHDWSTAHASVTGDRALLFVWLPEEEGFVDARNRPQAGGRYHSQYCEAMALRRRSEVIRVSANPPPRGPVLTSDRAPLSKSRGQPSALLSSL